VRVGLDQRAGFNEGCTIKRDGRGKIAMDVLAPFGATTAACELHAFEACRLSNRGTVRQDHSPFQNFRDSELVDFARVQ